MTISIRAAAVLAAALFLAGDAAAQNLPAVSVAPAGATRWDLAGHISWFGSRQPDIAPWNPWYNVGAGGVTVGYYFTPHLKLELQPTVAAGGVIYAPDTLLPSEPREHHLQASTLHAGAVYQFFENQWFHPFVGAGVEVVGERHRADVPQHFVASRDPTLRLVPGVRGVDRVSVQARPFINTGFKWFVADRAFVRTELATSVAEHGVAQAAWSAGIGFEF